MICDTVTYSGTLNGIGRGALTAFIPSALPGVLLANATEVLQTPSGDLRFTESTLFNALSTLGSPATPFVATAQGDYTPKVFLP
ncbi:MAG: hypothetical protein NVSMB32_07660 [Actinomycetota bacterium]